MTGATEAPAASARKPRAREGIFETRRLQWLIALLVGVALMAAPRNAVLAQEPPGCQFVLGFAQLRQFIGEEIVGHCLENEQFNPGNGNAEQPTDRGLLVWRKVDNWTAFTDGYRTWILGPDGLQQRLNTERFPWERDPIIPLVSAGGPETAFVRPIEVSNVTTGWGPAPEAAILYPHVRFTITNLSAEAVPIYADELLYSAVFLDQGSQEPYGTGLGVSTRIGLDGLRPGYGEEIVIQTTTGYLRGSEPRPRLMVELYQGNPLTGQQLLVGTYSIAVP
jgi:hypothetical protein